MKRGLLHTQAEGCVTQRKMIAITVACLKWAVVEKFRGYLLGSWFEVIMDNNLLCHLQTAKLGVIEQRWVAQLSVFNFEVKYRPGKSNAAADALSRQEFAGEPESDPDADWNVCVAICSVISRGTALGPALALKGVECTRLRRLSLEKKLSLVSKATPIHFPATLGNSWLSFRKATLF